MPEEGFDLQFSAARALQRNRIIHSFSEKTFVAQCSLGKGGTWSGTADNLRKGWSQVICYDDGSDASRELACMGAVCVDGGMLKNIGQILPGTDSFL